MGCTGHACLTMVSELGYTGNEKRRLRVCSLYTIHLIWT